MGMKALIQSYRPRGIKRERDELETGTEGGGGGGALKVEAGSAEEKALWKGSEGLGLAHKHWKELYGPGLLASSLFL